jgi:hypothetical protein
MANLSTAAGNGGVAGNVNFATRTVTGAYASTYADNGNLAVSDNHAVRRSVSRTHGTATRLWRVLGDSVSSYCLRWG